MKFELVEPSAESDGNADVAAPGDPAPSDVIAALEEPDAASPGPVRERRARAVEGVRASLRRLRAQAAEQSMAQAHRLAASPPAAEAGAVFHAHRFTAHTPGKGDR